jgi:hypothetical protein
MKTIHPFDRIAELVGTKLAEKLYADFNKSADDLEDRLCMDINSAVIARISLTKDELTHLPKEVFDEAIHWLAQEYNQSLSCLTSRIAAHCGLQCNMNAAAFIRHEITHFEESLEETQTESFQERRLVILMERSELVKAPTAEGAEEATEPKDPREVLHDESLHRMAKRHSSGN